MNNLVDNKATSIQVLLLGGSAGSLELNEILIKELKKLNSNNFKNIQLSVQIPRSHFEEYKLKYLSINNNINFFSYNDNLRFEEYDFIISRSGSGSLNDILYKTGNVLLYTSPPFS